MLMNLKNLFLGICCTSMIACSGNIDTNDTQLHISADKTTLTADGKDAVTFNVTYGSEDVSASKDMVITVISEGISEELLAGTNRFSTTVSGEYTFTASYLTGEKTIKSAESIKVKAEAPASVSSGYYHKLLAMEFTSTFCTYCPDLAAAVSNVQASHPDRIIAVAFHSSRMDSPSGRDDMALALNEKIYEKVAEDANGGLPLFAFSFRKSQSHIVNEYTKIVSELEYQLENHEPDCGVAIESSFTENTRKLEVKARFKSDVCKAYRYHIFIVEDGIEGAQAGIDGTYIHDNVLRKIVSDNANGSKLNDGDVLIPGEEYSVTRSIDIPENWNEGNMRIVVSIMENDADNVWTCDNSNECILGENSDYLYED